MKINGEMRYLWRAVDHEGEVLESFVTKTRDKAAALKFIKKAMKRHGQPMKVVTDGLRSYAAAMREIWQGRAGLNFGPGYQVKNGVTTVHDDIVATPTFDMDNKLSVLDVQIGGDSYGVELDAMGSPIHYFGPLVRTSVREPPVRSWCWIEYVGGKMSGERLDEALKPFRLARGR